MPAPKTIPEQTLLDIISDIKTGIPLHEACKARKLAMTTVLKHLQNSTRLYECYRQAREHRADALAERLEEMEAKTIAGGIVPKAFHAVSRSMQWRMGKMNPKQYSDRIKVQHEGTINIASEIAESRRKAIIESIDNPAVEQSQESIPTSDNVEDAVLVPFKQGS